MAVGQPLQRDFPALAIEELRRRSSRDHHADGTQRHADAPCGVHERLDAVVRDYASAAMDVSDGLAGDLTKLCGVSAVSAVIDLDSVPLSDTGRDLVSRGIAGLETLIAGGDDYEILCTVADDRVEAFVHAAGRVGVALSSIGMVVAGTSAPKFLDRQGREIALKRLSYSHF